MKTKIFFSILSFGLILSAIGQRTTIELTYSAIDNAEYIQLDRIKVSNLTQGSDTILYWPDTVLVLDYQVGFPDIIKAEENNLQVFQNYPNPVKDQTTLVVFVPEKNNMKFRITDILGNSIINKDFLLDKGYHSFRFTPSGSSIYFFTVCMKEISKSVKILTVNNNLNKRSSFKYIGSKKSAPELKATKPDQKFIYSSGDELLCIGYYGVLQSGIIDSPENSESYIFQFATNIPCPGTPTLEYEGQTYNTIQIFNQCWIKENLNVGYMIPGTSVQSNNGIIEKYCYNNEQDSCDKYGGLYQWDELMHYDYQSNITQGICPQGWHIPSDAEWKILEGAVDNVYGIGDLIWNEYHERGYDAGENLKSTSGWNQGGNGNGLDLFGFTGTGAGMRSWLGGFLAHGSAGYYFTTTTVEWDDPIYRVLESYRRQIVRDISYGYGNGMSVRCIKNE